MLKTVRTDQTPEEFLESLSPDRQEILRAVDAVIRKALPKQKPKMWTQFIGYGDYHYTYASGREGDWFLIGLASMKSYVSLYICAAEDGKYLAEVAAKQLGKVSVGKSCIRFKKLEDIDLDVVAKLCKQAEALANAGHYLGA